MAQAQAAGFRWIKWARDRHVGAAGQVVLLSIATHCNAAGDAFLSHARLAAETGGSRGTVKRALKVLAADGYLTATGLGYRTANTYHLGGSQLRMLESEPVAEAAAAKPKRAAKRAPSADPEAAFYAAKNQGEATGALVDACTAKGRKVLGKRMAGFVKHQAKRSRGDVWKALAIALDTELKGCPINYAEEILKNGRTPTRSRKPGGGKKSTAPAYERAATDW